MTIEQEREVVATIVHNIYVPKMRKELSVFMRQYEKTSRQNWELEKITGIPIVQAPVHLKLGQPITELIENIVAVIEIAKKNADNISKIK